MTTAFKGLIGSQFAVGFFMFVFGLVDKLKVKSVWSFILMPIWIGLLVIFAGICAILIGNYHRRRGFVGPNMVSGLKAINIFCAALAFYSLYCYGTLLARFNQVTDKVPVNGDSKLSLARAITCLLMILSIAEMLCGVWLALLDKEGMYLGSTPPLQHQDPVAMNYGVQQVPRQATQPPLRPTYDQQQQQRLSHQVPTIA